MTLPAHVADHINTTTGLDITTPAGRTGARATRCPRCHAPVLTGLDDTVAAFTATADPWPLTRSDEATALLAGRDTYRLTDPPRVELRRRDRWQITGKPAGTVTVVAAHACGHPLGTPRPATDRSPASDRIPF